MSKAIPMRGITVITMVLFLAWVACTAQAAHVSGSVSDPQEAPVEGADLKLVNAGGSVIGKATTDDHGRFMLVDVDPGDYQLHVESPSFVSVVVDVSVAVGQEKWVTIQFQQIVTAQQQVTVVASAAALLTPDPTQTAFIHDEVLDANPGRPGVPISIPGLPVETASGGIKAPQYFAPGVAGDHGEPIAQYFQIGDVLYPNNLPANAHGNGYADPNFLIAPTIEAAGVDGGAFNVRQGNNAVDLATECIPWPRVNSLIQLTGDYRDGDLVAGWGSPNPHIDEWIALEASFGNGFLPRPEHRQQYKLTGLRHFNFGRHQLMVFAAGYYGSSYIPGLIPINAFVAGDTIDKRQLEYTRNALAVINDNWKLGEQRQFSFSGFYRNYGLTLRSNFGDGLIQQSEARDVSGGEMMYTQSVRSWIALLAGVDIRRDAPRDLDPPLAASTFRTRKRTLATR